MFVRSASHISEFLQRVDRLRGALFGNAQPAAELTRGSAVRSDRLEDETVQRSGVGMTLARQFGVQLVDQPAKRHEEPQRQLVFI